MATRHKPLPITEENVDEVLSERAAVRHEAGLGDAPDGFGSYLASHREKFVARFKQVQQALASKDSGQVSQLGDEARRSEAKAIVAEYPK